MAKASADDDMSKAVEVLEAEGVIVGREGDAGLADFLGTQRDLESDDSTDAYRLIIGQIMSAATPDEVLTPIEVMSAKDVVGMELLLRGVSFRQSEFDVGSPFYASMEMQRPDNGNSVVVNTGHQGMMAQLVKLNAFNEFPYRVKVTASNRPNRFGTYPLRLEKW